MVEDDQLLNSSPRTWGVLPAYAGVQFRLKAFLCVLGVPGKHCARSRVALGALCVPSSTEALYAEALR